MRGGECSGAIEGDIEGGSLESGGKLEVEASTAYMRAKNMV